LDGLQNLNPARFQRSEKLLRLEGNSEQTLENLKKQHLKTV